MSIHKARPEGENDPTAPTSAVMLAGRYARPHAEVDGKPVLGGLQNAHVEGAGRTPEEEKEYVKEFNEARKAVKESEKENFDPKTGQPKVHQVPTPSASPTASPQEIKKNAEAEKKYNEGKVDLQPPKDGEPTKPVEKKDK